MSDAATAFALYNRYTSMELRYKNLLHKLEVNEVLRELTDPVFVEFPDVVSLHWSQYYDEDDDYMISDLAICSGGDIDEVSKQGYTTLAMVIKNPARWGGQNLGDIVRQRFSYLNIENIDRFHHLTSRVQRWLYTNTDYLSNTMGYVEVSVFPDAIELSIDDQ